MADGRWLSKGKVREARRASAERLADEREARLNDLANWLDEHGSRGHGTEIRLAIAPVRRRRRAA